MSASGRYARVALPLGYKFHSGGLDGLTYSIPDDLTASAVVGTRVSVPLGKRFVTGVLVSVSTDPPPDVKKFKPIEDVLDPLPVFDPVFLEWTKWIAEYYLTSWGEVLEAALPQGFRPETKAKVSLISPDIAPEAMAMHKKAPKRAEFLLELTKYPNGVFLSHLAKRTKLRSLYAHAQSLV